MWGFNGRLGGILTDECVPIHPERDRLGYTTHVKTFLRMVFLQSPRSLPFLSSPPMP